FLLAHGLAVELGDRVVDRLGEHRSAADVAGDELRRSLSWPEPLDPDLLGERLVGHVEGMVEFLKRNLDSQLDPGGAQLLDSGLHGAVLLVSGDDTRWRPVSPPHRATAVIDGLRPIRPTGVKRLL